MRPRVFFACHFQGPPAPALSIVPDLQPSHKRENAGILLKYEVKGYAAALL